MATPPVSLTELKAHLNKASGASVDDAELSMALGAATGIAEHEVGPIVATSVTERVAASGGALLLRRTPVLSVQSITLLGGDSLSLSGLWVDGDPGLVFDGSRGFGSARYTVSYTAGRTPVPDDLKLAVLIIAGHLWETQRGGSARPALMSASPGDSGGSGMYRGFAVPHRAAQLLGSHARVVVA